MDKVEIIKEIRVAASKLRNGKLKNLDRLAPTLEKIRAAIGLDTIDEVVVFVAVMDRQCSSETTVVSDLADYFGCSTIDVATYYKTIKSLITNNFLIVTNRYETRFAKVGFKVDTAVFNAIVEGRSIPSNRKPAETETDRFVFCKGVDGLVKAREDGEFNTGQLMSEVEIIEEMNRDLPFVKDVLALLPDIETRILFYVVCNDYRPQNDHFSGIDGALDSIYDGIQDQARVKLSLLNGSHPVLTAGLVEVESKKILLLTDKGSHLYFNELAPLFATDDSGLNRYDFAHKIYCYADSLHRPVYNPSDERQHSNCSVSDNKQRLYNKVLRMEANNPQLNMIGKLKTIVPWIIDRVIFYMICNRMMEYRQFPMKDLSNALDYSHEIMARRELKAGRHQLQKTGLVTVKDGSFMESTCLEWTHKGKDLFLEEDINLYEDNIAGRNIIQCADIPEKKLFFDGTLERRLASLRDYLQEDRYSSICESLKRQNRSVGMSVLFYGDAGTGKTESVMQIARATGRAIIHVDISATKTCWFGESEKLIKGVFTDYRRVCERGGLKPILLFNEADGVFSKRKDNSAGIIDQTENTIQNIILEEMENLDGILIATTNMETNFDTAFERRFLFKIRFGKPTEQARASIWRDKMPSLSETDATRLAALYDFSGGEIDNVARKAAIAEAFSGCSPTIDSLKEICSEERLARHSSRRIGFASGA